MTTHRSIIIERRAWAIISDTAKDLGMKPEDLVERASGGNLAAQIKAARSVVANPNDTTDQNYDLAMSLKALGVP